MRFWEVNNGAITIGGKNINEITTLKELSEHYYLIPKDIKMSEEEFLFLDFNNILDVSNGFVINRQQKNTISDSQLSL